MEIQAVPETRNENVLQLFRNLCKTINLQIDDNMVHSCRRVAKFVASSSRPRNILVTLSSSRVRDEVLSACLRYNKQHKELPLNTTSLGLPLERGPIYVNEHLSPDCKALHAATRAAAKNKKYKYVWVRYGRIYVRKDDNAGCILIKTKACLDKLT